MAQAKKPELELDPWWNWRRVGEHFGGKSSDCLSRWTIDRWVRLGILHPPVRFGPHKRWRRSWVLEAERRLQEQQAA